MGQQVNQAVNIQANQSWFSDWTSLYGSAAPNTRSIARR